MYGTAIRMYAAEHVIRCMRLSMDLIMYAAQHASSSIRCMPLSMAAGVRTAPLLPVQAHGQREPSPTLSPTDPVPGGLLTLCPGASSGQSWPRSRLT